MSVRAFCERAPIMPLLHPSPARAVPCTAATAHNAPGRRGGQREAGAKDETPAPVIRHRRGGAATGPALAVLRHAGWNAAISVAADWRETVAAG